MTKKPTENSVAGFPDALGSCEAMKRLVTEHLATDPDTRSTSAFAYWVISSPQFNEVRKYCNSPCPTSVLVDCLAIAIGRSIDFDPARDVETEKQAKDWRDKSRNYMAAIIRHDYTHPNPVTDKFGRQYLTYMTERPRARDRDIKHDGNTRRRMFVRILANEVEARVDFANTNIVTELAAIVDPAITPGYVRRQNPPAARKAAVRCRHTIRTTAIPTASRPPRIPFHRYDLSDLFYLPPSISWLPNTSGMTQILSFNYDDRLTKIWQCDAS